MTTGFFLHVFLGMQPLVINGLRNEISEKQHTLTETKSIEVSAPGSIAQSTVAANRSEGESVNAEDMDEQIALAEEHPKLTNGKWSVDKDLYEVHFDNKKKYNIRVMDEDLWSETPNPMQSSFKSADNVIFKHLPGGCASRNWTIHEPRTAYKSGEQRFFGLNLGRGQGDMDTACRVVAMLTWTNKPFLKTGCCVMSKDGFECCWCADANGNCGGYAPAGQRTDTQRNAEQAPPRPSSDDDRDTITNTIVEYAPNKYHFGIVMDILNKLPPNELKDLKDVVEKIPVAGGTRQRFLMRFKDDPDFRFVMKDFFDSNFLNGFRQGDPQMDTLVPVLESIFKMQGNAGELKEDLRKTSWAQKVASATGS